VEVAVEVEDALVHEDAGDGQLLGEGGAAPGAGFRAGGLRPADVLADERELLRGRALRIPVRLSVLAAHPCIVPNVTDNAGALSNTPQGRGELRAQPRRSRTRR